MGEPRSAIENTIGQLDADATAHKRIARQNRDQAAKKFALRDELIAWCIANGIPVKKEGQP